MATIGSRKLESPRRSPTDVMLMMTNATKTVVELNNMLTKYEGIEDDHKFLFLHILPADVPIARSLGLLQGYTDNLDDESAKHLLLIMVWGNNEWTPFPFSTHQDKNVHFREAKIYAWNVGTRDAKKFVFGYRELEGVYPQKTHQVMLDRHRLCLSMHQGPPMFEAFTKLRSMYGGFLNKDYYWEQTENQILTVDEYAQVQGENRDPQYLNIFKSSFNACVKKFAEGQGGTVPEMNPQTNPFGRPLTCSDRSTQRSYKTNKLPPDPSSLRGSACEDDDEEEIQEEEEKVCTTVVHATLPGNQVRKKRSGPASNSKKATSDDEDEEDDEEPGADVKLEDIPVFKPGNYEEVAELLRVHGVHRQNVPPADRAGGTATMQKFLLNVKCLETAPNKYRVKGHNIAYVMYLLNLLIRSQNSGMRMPGIGMIDREISDEDLFKYLKQMEDPNLSQEKINQLKLIFIIIMLGGNHSLDAFQQATAAGHKAFALMELYLVRYINETYKVLWIGNNHQRVSEVQNASYSAVIQQMFKTFNESSDSIKDYIFDSDAMKDIRAVDAIYRTKYPGEFKSIKEGAAELTATIQTLYGNFLLNEKLKNAGAMNISDEDFTKSKILKALQPITLLMNNSSKDVNVLMEKLMEKAVEGKLILRISDEKVHYLESTAAPKTLGLVTLQNMWRTLTLAEKKKLVQGVVDGLYTWEQFRDGCNECRNTSLIIELLAIELMKRGLIREKDSDEEFDADSAILSFHNDKAYYTSIARKMVEEGRGGLKWLTAHGSFKTLVKASPLSSSNANAVKTFSQRNESTLDHIAACLIIHLSQRDPTPQESSRQSGQVTPAQADGTSTAAAAERLKVAVASSLSQASSSSHSSSQLDTMPDTSPHSADFFDKISSIKIASHDVSRTLGRGRAAKIIHCTMLTTVSPTISGYIRLPSPQKSTTMWKFAPQFGESNTSAFLHGYQCSPMELAKLLLLDAKTPFHLLIGDFGFLDDGDERIPKDQEAEIYTLFGKANTVKSWNVVRINDIAHQSRAYSVLKKHEFTAGVTPVCFQQSNDKGGPIASADKFRKGEIVHGVIGYLDSRGGKPQFDPVAHFPYLDSVLMKNCEKNLGDLKSLVLTVPSTQSKATLLDPSGNPFGDEERYPQRSAGFASILAHRFAGPPNGKTTIVLCNPKHNGLAISLVNAGYNVIFSESDSDTYYEVLESFHIYIRRAYDRRKMQLHLPMHAVYMRSGDEALPMEKRLFVPTAALFGTYDDAEANGLAKLWPNVLPMKGLDGDPDPLCFPYWTMVSRSTFIAIPINLAEAPLLQLPASSVPTAASIPLQVPSAVPSTSPSKSSKRHRSASSSSSDNISFSASHMKTTPVFQPVPKQGTAAKRLPLPQAASTSTLLLDYDDEDENSAIPIGTATDNSVRQLHLLTGQLFGEGVGEASPLDLPRVAASGSSGSDDEESCSERDEMLDEHIAAMRVADDGSLPASRVMSSNSITFTATLLIGFEDDERTSYEFAPSDISGYNLDVERIGPPDSDGFIADMDLPLDERIFGDYDCVLQSQKIEVIAQVTVIQSKAASSNYRGGILLRPVLPRKNAPRNDWLLCQTLGVHFPNLPQQLYQLTSAFRCCQFPQYHHFPDSRLNTGVFIRLRRPTCDVTLPEFIKCVKSGSLLDRDWRTINTMLVFVPYENFAKTFSNPVSDARPEETDDVDLPLYCLSRWLGPFASSRIGLTSGESYPPAAVPVGNDGRTLANDVMTPASIEYAVFILSEHPHVLDFSVLDNPTFVLDETTCLMCLKEQHRNTEFLRNAPSCHAISRKFTFSPFLRNLGRRHYGDVVEDFYPACLHAGCALSEKAAWFGENGGPCLIDPSVTDILQSIGKDIIPVSVHIVLQAVCCLFFGLVAPLTVGTKHIEGKPLLNNMFICGRALRQTQEMPPRVECARVASATCANFVSGLHSESPAPAHHGFGLRRLDSTSSPMTENTLPYIHPAFAVKLQTPAPAHQPAQQQSLFSPAPPLALRQSPRHRNRSETSDIQSGGSASKRSATTTSGRKKRKKAAAGAAEHPHGTAASSLDALPEDGESQ